VIEQKPEKKVKVVVQEEAVDTSKPTDDEKTRVFPVDFERWTSKWHSAVSERKIGESWELPIFLGWTCSGIATYRNPETKHDLDNDKW